MLGESPFLPEEKQFITETQHILENIKQSLSALWGGNFVHRHRLSLERVASGYSWKPGI